MKCFNLKKKKDISFNLLHQNHRIEDNAYENVAKSSSWNNWLVSENTSQKLH